MNSIFPEDNSKLYSPVTSPRPNVKAKKRIIIEFVDQKDQRYDTVGDYFNSGMLNEVIMRISLMGDERYEMLVAVHELIEMILCRHAGITNEQIDKFDIGWKDFEDKFGEPGNDPRAPYYDQHQFAIGVEQNLAEALEVDWAEYEEKIESLFPSEEKQNEQPQTEV